MDNVGKNACLIEQYDTEAAIERHRQSVSTCYGGVSYPMDVAYLEEIGKFLTRNTAMLDVGCGEGEFLLSEICRAKQSAASKLSVRPKQVFAVDYSPVSIDTFRKQLDEVSKPNDFPDVRLFTSDMRTIGELNLPPCDMIVSRYVLNHVQSLEEMASCFRQLRATLKSDGHLVILVNAYESHETPSVFQKLPRGNLVPILVPGNVKLTVPGYSISDFICAFHAAGFTVKRLVAMDGWKPAVQDQYHDGGPFPREKVTPFAIIVTCVPASDVNNS